MILPGLKLQTRTLVLSIGMALVPFVLMSVGVTTQVRGALMHKAEADHRSIVSRLLHTFDADFGRLTHRIPTHGI